MFYCLLCMLPSKLASTLPLLPHSIIIPKMTSSDQQTAKRLSAHPNFQLSDFVHNLKTASSRRIRKLYQVTHSPWKPVFRHRSYCIISAGGSSLSIRKRYIELQGPDNTRGHLTPLRHPPHDGGCGSSGGDVWVVQIDFAYDRSGKSTGSATLRAQSFHRADNIQLQPERLIHYRRTALDKRENGSLKKPGEKPSGCAARHQLLPASLVSLARSLSPWRGTAFHLCRIEAVPFPKISRYQN
jgi:hypothetical protein